MKDKVLIIVMILASAFLGFCLAHVIGVPPEISYYPVDQVVVVEKIVEVERVEYVDRIKEVPIMPRNFETLEELEEWLSVRAFIAFGDCDDWALALQGFALEDGYLLNFKVITPGEYNKLFKLKVPLDEVHAINLALIGNEIWYIEPFNKEVQLAYYLD